MPHKKQGRIGQQQGQQRSFPVVMVRFRPAGDPSPGICGRQRCASEALLGGRAQAAFLAQSTLDYQDITALQDGAFTLQEQKELAWEKAYREQRAGREPSSAAYPICTQCASDILTWFLGGSQGEEKATAVLVASLATGHAIVLFDRNLSRERTDPCVALGTFATLAEFRAQYWREVA